MMKYIIRRILFWSFVLFMLMLLAVPCVSAAGEAVSKPIKVAYFDCGEYYQIQKDGSVVSYDTACLQEIADVYGLTFQYVDCKTWSNALEMLNNHEVDLLGTVQKNEEREQEYAFCDNGYGITASELVALPDSQICYEDYKAIGSSKLGVLTDYVRMNELNNLLKIHSLTPDIRYYTTQEELFAALRSGEVDLIAANSHTLPRDWKAVEKYDYSSFYFATWKGNEQLTDTLDKAILQASLYSELFHTELQQQYFPNLMKDSYSAAEQEYIKQQPVLNVYLNDGSEPLTYRDEEGHLTGILVKMCDIIEKQTGLKFNYCAMQDKEDTPAGTTIEVNVPDDGLSTNAVVTDSFFSTDFYLYYRVGNRTGYEKNGNYKIALPGNRPSYIDYLSATYPNSQVVTMETPEECIRAVSEGKVDLTMLNSYLVDNICIRKNITNIEALPSRGITMDFSLILEGPGAEQLADILDKGISEMDEQEKNGIVIDNALNTMPDNTLQYFIQNNIPVVILVLVLLTAMVCSLVYTHILIKKNAVIKKATLAKSDFLSHMSHDMRTPMNGILGITNLLKDRTDPEEIKKDVEQIQFSAQYLLSLINDTLDMSKIESGKMELHTKPISSENLFGNVISTAKILAMQKGVKLKIEVPQIEHGKWVPVIADAARVEQVFINLISNAIKFTPKEGVVTLHMDSIEIGENTVTDHYVVSDTGIGMSGEFQKHLFEPFSQEGRKVDSVEGGTGLGLAIVKQIIDLMGGKIWFESCENEGTSFIVELTYPRYHGELGKQSDRTVDLSILKGKRVLLCEDHPINAQIATRLLNKEGIVVERAENGKIGVDLFQKSTEYYYDAVLMDIRMPVMNGIEAAREIRRMTKRKDALAIPIIAMTANAFDDDREETKAAGMNAHLAKPVDPDILYNTLSRLIESNG